MNFSLRKMLASSAFLLGEGLIIGVGVAVVLTVYSAMNNATNELRVTRNQLEQQIEINQQLKNQIELRDSSISRVDDLIEQNRKIFENIEKLAERLRTIEEAGVAYNSPTNVESIDWSSFDVPETIEISEPSVVKGNMFEQLEGLQEAINAQKNSR